MSVNTGVYQILNIVTNDFYVGSTAWDFKRRWKIHQRQLKSNQHPNQHLQHAWNKYGGQNFRLDILEKCPPSQCLLREQHYLNTLHPSYNILKVAGSVLGYKHTPASRRIIGDAARGKNNSGYSGEHTFYHPDHGIFSGSISEFGAKFNMRKSLPYKLTQRVLSKTHGWIYIGKSPSELPANLPEFYHSRCHNNRPVYSFIHKNGKTFSGTMAEFVVRYNLDRSVISKLIRGIRRFAYGWVIKN